MKHILKYELIGGLWYLTEIVNGERVVHQPGYKTRDALKLGSLGKVYGTTGERLKKMLEG